MANRSSSRSSRSGSSSSSSGGGGGGGDGVVGQRTALVTGSSNGIGEAIVKRLAKLDYKLVVTGRDEADIRRVAGECERLSPSKTKPLEVVADLAHEPDVARLFEASMDYFGRRLDLLVNNAGLGQPVGHEQAEACYLAYKQLMQVNLNSAVQLSLLAAGPLKRTALDYCQNKPTSVINIASIAAHRSTQTLAAYSTSKAGLTMFSRCMAVELAPLVRCNSICPGPVETKIIERSGFPMDLFKLAAKKVAPLQRVGQPDELADAVLFLANQQTASFITGADLIVDGGCLAAPFVFQP